MNFKKILFATLLLVAIFFRVFNLANHPPSLNWDEVSIGYNAYSILKIGRDEWGESLPLSVRAYGDYKLPGYIYLSVPFIATLGLNEIALRLPSVLFGVGTVLFIFLIIRKTTNSFILSLIGMSLAALLPWLVITSRIALEANLALFLTVASIYLFLVGLEKDKYLILSAVLAALSIFSYNSSRVITLPLFFLAIFLFKNKLKFNKNSFVASVLLITSFFIAVPLAILQDSSARYRWTKILDEGAIASINEQRERSNSPDIIKKIAYNKLTYFVPKATSNYLVHFHPNFLFLNGGSHFQYSVPGSGLIFLPMLPFLFLGLIQIFRQKLTWGYFMLGWLLISPLPAAITRDAPHALRSIFLSIPLILVTVEGVVFIKGYFKRKLFIFLIVIFSFLNSLIFLDFWKNYTGEYTKKYSWSWQYGYRQVADYVRRHQHEYQKIFLTKKYGEPHEFVLFYLQYDPEKFQMDPNLIRYKRSDWYWVDKFDKFEFLNDWEIIEKVDREEDILLITSPGNYPARAKILEKVKFLDNGEAFDIVRL